MKETWQRPNKDNLKESILDHIYTNYILSCVNVFNEKQIVGDHNLIGLELKHECANYPNSFPTTIMDWTKYSKEKLISKLSTIDFGICENMNVTQHVSELNQILGTILDELVPTIVIKRKEIPGFISLKHIKQKRTRNNLYKKFKKTFQ